MAKKEKELTAEAEAMDTDHDERRTYELGFHLDPELSVDEARKAYNAIHEKIASVGTVVAEGEPQKIQLAYTVSRTEQSVRKDFDASYFAWIAYDADGVGHTAVTDLAKETRAIFRFLDVRTDKEAAKHAAEMHEIMMKAAQPQAEAGEEVSEVELDAALKEAGV